MFFSPRTTFFLRAMLTFNEEMIRKTKSAGSKSSTMFASQKQNISNKGKRKKRHDLTVDLHSHILLRDDLIISGQEKNMVIGLPPVGSSINVSEPTFPFETKHATQTGP